MCKYCNDWEKRKYDMNLWDLMFEEPNPDWINLNCAILNRNAPILFTASENDEIQIPINYCPFCGKRLV